MMPMPLSSFGRPRLVPLVAALAGCVTPPPAPVIWDKSHLPTIEPLTVDGRCTLVVSGTASFKDKAFSRVSLNVERGKGGPDCAR